MSTRDFKLAIAQKNIPGYSYVAKFGANPGITAGTSNQDIWEVGGEYQFSSNGVSPIVGIADIVSISSSNASDTQTVLIYGLGADGVSVAQFATMNGQARVALTTPLWRIWRVENWDSTSFVGNIYVYSGTENTDGVPSGASVTKAYVYDGNNQTQMAIYTVPAGHVAFLDRAEVGFGFSGGPAAGPEEAHFQFQVRTYGQVFKVKKEVSLISFANSSHVDVRPFPDPIPALSDIKLQCTMASEDIHAWSTFHLYIVRESELSTELLESIFQPGYV